MNALNPDSVELLGSLPNRDLASASTHDATRVPPPRRRWLTRVALPLALLLAASSLILASASRTLWPGIDILVVPVLPAVAIEHAGVPPSATAAQAGGWLEPAPYAINVSALTDGVVRELLVLEGQRVEAGQIVAHLIDDDARLALAMAEADLAERRAELATAEATVRAAQQTWDEPVERQRDVATAEARRDAAAAAIAAAQADLRAAESLVAERRDEATRSESLRGSGVAEGEYVRLTLRLAAAAAALEQARANVPAAEAFLREQEALALSAREMARLRTGERLALELSKASADEARAAIARATAVVSEAQLRLDRTAVRAAAGGVVMNRLVEPGSRVELTGNDMRSAFLLRLYDPAQLQVRVDVPLADAHRIGLDQAAEITTEALPGRTFAGRVVRLVHEANIQRNTVQVKVLVEDPDPEMRPEMLCRVRLLGARGGTRDSVAANGAAPDGVAVRARRDTLARDAASGDEWHAFVFDVAAQRLRRRTLRVAEANGLDTAPPSSWITVLKGLRPGDRLVVNPSASLGDGARVRNVEEQAGESAEGGSS